MKTSIINFLIKLFAWICFILAGYGFCVYINNQWNPMLFGTWTKILFGLWVLIWSWRIVITPVDR